MSATRWPAASRIFTPSQGWVPAPAMASGLKARAMTMLARKIARAVYQMLKRKEAFDAVKFFAS